MASILASRDQAGTWDDTARDEYLSGFRKRKRERRVKGHAHAALKERQARLDARKARREALKARLARLPDVAKIQESTTTTRDDLDLFGNQVVVSTTLGLDVADDDKKEAPPQRVDTAQLRAGSLSAMCKKVAAKLGGSSAKALKRAALRRDRKAAAKAGKRLGSSTSTADAPKKKRRR